MTSESDKKRNDIEKGKSWNLFAFTSQNIQ